MIGSLRGTLLDRSVTGEVLVEVAGVGYRVTAGPVTAARLGDLGAEVFVWIHHHLREDAATLYGFASRDERNAFEALLGAHGVGPALALAILSVHEPLALHRVLAEDDVAALCLVPGVGKKTAARLLIELKARLDLPIDGVPVDLGAGGDEGGAGGAARADVREALAELGYQYDEIAVALRDLPDGDDTSALLREALKRLAAPAQAPRREAGREVGRS
jgi:Holliday junction DNA helicase RuvA